MVLKDQTQQAEALAMAYNWLLALHDPSLGRQDGLHPHEGHHSAGANVLDICTRQAPDEEVDHRIATAVCMTGQDCCLSQRAKVQQCNLYAAAVNKSSQGRMIQSIIDMPALRSGDRSCD